MDEVLKSSVTDPRGEKMLEALGAQELSALSAADLSDRIASLEIEIARCKKALEGRQGATAAAEALFKS